MLHKCYWITLLLILEKTCISQVVHSPVNIRYTELGTYSNNFLNAFSFTGNQAILSSLRKASAGVYSEKRFFLNELNLYSLAVVAPSAIGGFGMQATYFGFSDYNESRLGIAYGKELGKTIALGIQFNYNLIHIAGYGNAGTMVSEICTMLHPAGKIHIGMHIYNPVGAKFGKNTGEKLASVYKAGIGYESSQEVLMSIEIVKEENKPVNVNAGLQYVFAKQFFAGIGIATESTSPYGGIGFSWKNIRIDISVSYHPQLGFTPGLLLLFGLKNKYGDDFN